MPIINGQWVNWTLNLTNSTLPDPLHTVTGNLPWFGLGIWAITYIALIALFYNNGYKEKWVGMASIGVLVTFGYRQISIVGVGAIMYSIFILALSIIAYALFKD